MTDPALPNQLPPTLPRFVRLALLAVLILHVWVATYVSSKNSVAYDEYAHIAAGAAYVTHRDGLAIYNLSPPLARYPAGIAARLFGATVPGNDVASLSPQLRHWLYADSFARANADRYESLVRFVRLTTLPISLAGIVLTFLIARRWADPWLALLTSAAVAFEPGYLSHAALVGTDLPLVVATLFVVHCVLRSQDQNKMSRAALLGLACAVAFGCKFPGIPIAFAAIVIVVVWSRRSLIQCAAHLLVILLTAWLAIFAMYQGLLPWTSLSPDQFSSGLMKSVAGFVPALPVPGVMLEGFDTQAFEADGRYHAALFGTVYQGANLLYWPMVVLTKWPLGVLVLLGLCVWQVKQLRPAWPIVLVAATFTLAMLVGVSINIGVRYLMPVIPLILLASVPLFSLPAVRTWMIAALVAVPLESALAWPNPLGFYNAPARLLDCPNAVVQDEDWGQSLIELRDWMRDNNVDRVRLAYFGRVDPATYGVTYDPIDDPSSTAKYVAVSRLVMTGVPLRMQTATGGPRSMQYPLSARLLAIPPDAKLGSIWLWKAERVAGLL